MVTRRTAHCPPGDPSRSADRLRADAVSSGRVRLRGVRTHRHRDGRRPPHPARPRRHVGLQRSPRQCHPGSPAGAQPPGAHRIGNGDPWDDPDGRYDGRASPRVVPGCSPSPGRARRIAGRDRDGPRSTRAGVACTAAGAGAVELGCVREDPQRVTQVLRRLLHSASRCARSVGTRLAAPFEAQLGGAITPVLVGVAGHLVDVDGFVRRAEILWDHRPTAVRLGA